MSQPSESVTDLYASPGCKSSITLDKVGHVSGIPFSARVKASLTFGQYCFNFQTGQCSYCMESIRSTTGFNISIRPSKS